MRNFCISLIIPLFMFALSSKAAVPITGKIIEEATGKPLEFTNIVLLTLPDSVFVTGTTTGEDGLFRFDNVNNGNYLLRISFIGLENKLIPVELSTNPVNVGDILLKESNTLREVVVTSKIPPFQAGMNGGIVANVSTTLLSTVGTASDVLQRMPGIIANNDQIMVFGKGTPIVYINNRRLNDLSELDRLESSEIATVELINNPGAKYDAAGQAVLLIKTKRKMNGFSAQATERLRQGKYLGDNENVSISYTNNKLNLFASYLHNYIKDETIENHFFTLNNPDSVWQYNTYMPSYRLANASQQVSTGFDYSLNDKQAIGGQYQYYTQNLIDVAPINTTTDLNGALFETSQAHAYSKKHSYRHLVNAFYNGDFSDRFSLHFDFDYLKNYDNMGQQSDETINRTETDTVEVFNRTDYDLYAGKLTNSYKSAIGLIEFGGEYNYITGNGFVQSNGYTDNTEFTNTEQKAAGFASYSHTIAKINLAAGLRYEFASELYTQGKAKTRFIDRTYSDWYPNISLSTAIKGIDLSLSFNKRTQRPNFNQLNGNVIYVNRFVFQKGNPYLNKTNNYYVNLQATKKPFYLNIGYWYAQNIISINLTEQPTNADAILLTYANFPKYEILYATLNWNSKVAFWQPNYTLNVKQPFFKSMYNGQEMAFNKINYLFKAYNDFTLPLGWVFSCNFQYQSDEQEGFVEEMRWKRLDLGLRKSVLNNSLRFNLMVYDVFNWVDDKSIAPINNFYWTSYRKSETRYATLSISYMFNNYKNKYRGGSAAQNDINRF